MIEIRHLKTLMALRDTGSLVEAAERIHLTQSALSHQLKDLEERLGCTLFIRKSKPLQFTGAGMRLLQLADDTMPLLRAAQRDLDRMAGGEVGRLHMSIECHSCFQWLMPTIDSFRNNWPEVEMDFASGFNFAPLPALARGELDLVITSDPQPLANVSYVPLFRYEGMLAVAKQHEFTRKHFITEQELAGETLIVYPVERDRLDVFSHFLTPAGIEPRETRSAELTIMMMQLVASGRGVCALPNWALTEYLERDYVRAVRLGEQGLWSTLYAAIRTETADAAYMKDFLRTAKDVSFRTLNGIQPVHQSEEH